jgi:hypothetical protein
MDIAEFIIGLAEGRTRWLNPSYGYRPARGVQNPHARKRKIPEPIQADLGCPDLAAKIFCF